MGAAQCRVPGLGGRCFGQSMLEGGAGQQWVQMDCAERGKPSCLRIAVWLDVADAVPVPPALKVPETSP